MDRSEISRTRRQEDRLTGDASGKDEGRSNERSTYCLPLTWTSTLNKESEASEANEKMRRREKGRKVKKLTLETGKRKNRKEN